MPETTVIYVDDTGAPAVAIIARRAAERAVVNAEAAAARAEAALGGIIPTLTAPTISIEGSITVDGPVDGAYTITLEPPQPSGQPDPLVLLASVTVDGASVLPSVSDVFTLTVGGSVSAQTLTAEWIAYNGVAPQASSSITVTLPAVGEPVAAPARMAAPTVAADGFDIVRVTRAAAPDDGGTSITGYDLQWSLDEETWTLVEGFASPYDIAGFAEIAATVYVQTRAVNDEGPGEWSLSGSDVTATLTPVSVATEAAFNPVAPIAGDDVDLVEPTFSGTAPIAVELTALRLDGVDVAATNNAGTLTIEGVGAGELVAVWTATGPGTGNTATSTATVTVEAQAPDLFVEQAGRVSTGTAQLSIGPVAGTNPSAMAALSYFEVPAGGMQASTVLWTTGGASAPYAYLSYTSTGTAYVAIYPVGGGEQNISFTTDPVQPGDRVAVVLAGAAGGSYRLYQSRNGGDFVSGGSTAIAGGSTFPIYGVPYGFFGKPVISEGQFIFGLDTLPASLADLASLNAAKASFVGSGGARPTIDAIKAALGTPAYAVYGPAASITANRGSAGGTFSLTGSITDYVPPAYTPSLVDVSNIQLRVAPLPTGIDDPAKPILAMVMAYNHQTASPTSADTVMTFDGSANYGFRIQNDGRGRLGVLYFDTATSANSETFLITDNPVTGTDRWNAFLGFAQPGGNLSLYGYDQDTDTIVLLKSAAIPATAQITVDGKAMALMATASTPRKYRVNSLAAWRLAVMPDLSDPRKFFDTNGLIVDPATTAAHLGGEPFAGFTGTAADMDAGLNSGSAAFTWTVDDRSGTGTVADLALTEVPGYEAPVTGGGGEVYESGATLLSASYATPDPLTTTIPEDTEMAGRISMVLDRSSVCLGEGVRAKVDGLTEEEAATLPVLWGFDTSGEFQFLSGLPWHIRQRNRATGHQQMIAYTDADGPGTKTISAMVCRYVGGELRAAIVSAVVTNRDPETEFTGRTMVLDPDNAYTGPHSRTASFATAYNQLKTWNGGRLLFPRGKTIDISATTASTAHVSINYQSGVMFGAWGTGDIPKVYMGDKNFNWKRTEIAPFFLIKDVEFYGGYDGLTGNGPRSELFSITAANPMTLNGVKTHHVSRTIETINPADQSPASYGALYVLDCHMTAWENFGLYCGQMDSVAVRGSYICQDPAYPAGYEAKELYQPGNQADHGPMRFNEAEGTDFVISQLRLFSTTGWTGGSDNTAGLFDTNRNGALLTKAAQPVLRLGAHLSEGLNANISECYAEGGGWTLGGGNGTYTVGSAFVAMHGNYTLYHAGWNDSSSSLTGSWIRDNIFVIPDCPSETINQASWRIIADVGCGGTAEKPDGGSVSATWHTKPIRIFNNTVAVMGTLAQRNYPSGGPTFDDFMVPGFNNPRLANYPDIIVQNNLFWCPNFTLAGEGSPRVPDGITSAGVYGPNPLYRGYHQEDENGVLQFFPEYATPVGSNILPMLSDTTALVGGADLSLFSQSDFFPRVGPATPAVGAIQPYVADV